MIKKLNNKSANAAKRTINVGVSFSSKFQSMLSEVYISDVKEAYKSEWTKVDELYFIEDELFCQCIKRIACVEVDGKFGLQKKLAITLSTDNEGNYVTDANSGFEVTLWAKVAKNSEGSIDDGDTCSPEDVGLIKRQHNSKKGEDGKPLTSWTAVIVTD